MASRRLRPSKKAAAAAAPFHLICFSFYTSERGVGGGGASLFLLCNEMFSDGGGEVAIFRRGNRVAAVVFQSVWDRPVILFPMSDTFGCC
jgi:hypothetical protein